MKYRRAKKQRIDANTINTARELKDVVDTVGTYMVDITGLDAVVTEVGSMEGWKGKFHRTKISYGPAPPPFSGIPPEIY